MEIPELLKQQLSCPAFVSGIMMGVLTFWIKPLVPLGWRIPTIVALDTGSIMGA